MTDTGVSKKVFVGTILASAVTTIATTDDSGESKLMYVYVIASLLVIYWVIQAVLDYVKRDKS